MKDKNTNKQNEDKTIIEKHILETFVKPVVIWTYEGRVLVKKRLKIHEYNLRIDGGRLLQKLNVLFAYPREEYDDIKKGISVNEQIQAQQLKPIEKREERPAVVSSESEYIRCTGKDVQITLRTGHVLTGHQSDVNDYNILLGINDKNILVYKHGILKYEIPNSK